MGRLSNSGLGGIVLSGGQSSRMGENKALMNFRGKIMLLHAMDCLNTFCEKVIISGSKEIYGTYSNSIAEDIYVDQGPLGGLHATLLSSDYERNAIITCDVPQMNFKVYKELLLQGDSDKIVVSRTRDGLQPLIGIYPRNCVESIELCIKNNKLRLTDLFDQYPVQIVDMPEEYDQLFLNLNTPKDFYDNA